MQEQRQEALEWIAADIVEATAVFSRAIARVVECEADGEISSFRMADLIEANARQKWSQRIAWLVQHKNMDHVEALRIVVKEAEKALRDVRVMSASTSAVANLMQAAHLEAAAKLISGAEWVSVDGDIA